ncbi:MAG: two pore domain potassium channel family protein [Lentimicrobiaceae bacterium]|nr:two pore domain potassium channel family protein [Lentimicrobiaceae bacterium]
MNIFTKLVNLKVLSTRKRKLEFSILLFIMNFIFVFIIGLFPIKSWIGELYSISVSGIFFASVISISDHHVRFLFLAIILTILTWVSTYMNLNIMLHFTSLISIIFFLYIIIISVIRIATSKEVGSLEFLRAVNIYFLIGIVGAIIFRSIYVSDPSAININDNNVLESTDLVYFSFETITTLGYGDISPGSPLAKNVSVLLSFAGQLYLTMIGALLIGKFLQNSEKKNRKENTNTSKK